MPKKLLDEAIPLSVEAAHSTDARNPYAALPSIRRVAALAASSARILATLASFVTDEGRRLGYARDKMQPMRTRIMLLRLPRGTAKDTVNALDEIAADYARLRADPHLPTGSREYLDSQFSSAISEAIVFRLLIESGRQEERVTCDAYVYSDNAERLSARNIDFVHAITEAKFAELYECKNQPGRLLARYYTRNAPGNEVDWRKEKLWLMLRVHGLLTKADWQVHLGCVTLPRRHAVEPDIEAMGGYPPELSIYYQEDLGTSFPPEMPN